MLNVKVRLCPHDAAEYIGGISYDKLMMMVRKNEIPHYRIGRRVFFTTTTLDEWIKEQELRSIQNG